MYKILLRATLIVAFLLPLAVHGQPGIEEIAEAKREMVSDFKVLKLISEVLAGIAGCIGGLRVYMKWQRGEGYIDGEIVSWFLGCFFSFLVGAVVGKTFGV